MSDSNDTSTIDEMNAENNGTSTNVNISGFLTSFITGLFGIYIYYKIGSLLVYASAISCSCELPTDTNLPPYDVSAVNSLKSKPVPIFDDKSTIQFPNYTDNLKYFFIDSARNTKKNYAGTETWTSHMCDFFITIYESLFSLNYSVIQLIYKFINKLGIPQIVILLLGPLCLFASIVILFIINWIYLLFVWITSLPIFIRNNAGLTEELVGYWSIFALFIVLIICAIFVFPIAIPLFLVMTLVSFSFILYKGTVTGNIKGRVNGPVGAGDILSGFLENYPRTLFLFLCLYLISIFFQNLGSIAGFASIVLSILILYFMDKIIEFFKNPPSLNITQILSKKSTSGTAAPITATPAAEPVAASKGGGNFNFLRELKKLQK